MSFNFGTPKTATGFTLPSNTAPATTAVAAAAGDTKLQSPFKPPSLTTPSSLAGGLSGAPPATLSFGLGSNAPSASLSFTGAAAPRTTAPIGFMCVPPSTASVQFGAGAPATVSSTAAPLKLPTSFSVSAASTTAMPTLSLALAATTTAAPLVATTVSTAATSGAAFSQTFGQLNDSISKWTMDLDEQGKFFINQTKQLNAWDSMLLSNKDKVETLSKTIERVKQQQKLLDQELDFVLAQQNELDEMSAPLEKKLTDIPVTDQNRFQMYQMSEVIDSQLKQMSEDLKEIVEHLNESNKNEDLSDPVIQVSRILNAHMNSLQWIDINTAQIGSHLEQVSKMHEIHKKNLQNL